MKPKLYEKMFNEDIKNSFLSNYPEKTQKSYRITLLKCYDTEELLNKDLYDFNYEELDTLFDSFGCKTFTSVSSVVSHIFSYMKWAGKNGYINSQISYSQMPEFKGNNLKKYIHAFANKTQYIKNRENFYEIVEHKIKNLRDAAPVVLLFEGVCGEEFEEIRNLKETDCNWNNNTITLTTRLDENGNPTQLILPKRSMEILRLATLQEEYWKDNGQSTYRLAFANINFTDYIIRYVGRNENKFEEREDKRVSVTTINQIFSKLRKWIKKQYINPKNVFLSGYFEYCRELESQKGELDTQDYKNLCIRFGINSNLWNSYKKKYLLFISTEKEIEQENKSSN